MRVTAKDVAAKAGLSLTTVSLVLNNRPSRIPEATQERVWQAVKELQYRPNRRAASLVTNRMGTIGIIVPDVCNIFFASICAACETEARLRDYSVLFGSSGDAVELDLNYIDVFFSKGVDGMILAKAAHTTPEDEDRLMAKILHTNIPFVTVDRKLNIQRGRSITVDHRLGAYMATRHLIGLGHKRIGCITGPVHDVVTRDRLEGYGEALAEAGIMADPALVCTGDYRIDSGAEHLPYLLGKSVTAVFCFNDLMAMGVYKGCRNYNLRIPEDLSVVGFDDIPFCEALEVPLSTVYQPAERIGAEAMKQVFNLLNHEEEARDFVFEPVLKVRASTSGPKYD
jgi:LacI family transcriptional regulator